MTIDVVKHKHLILPLALVALLFVSCEKSSDQQTYEDYDSHPTWTGDSTNNFWSKQSDITINF